MVVAVEIHLLRWSVVLFFDYLWSAYKYSISVVFFLVDFRFAQRFQ